MAPGEYKYLSSRDLITKDIEELRQEIQNQREEQQEALHNTSAPMVATTTDVVMADEPEIDEILPEQVTTLRGHTSEVFICTWSPTEDLLASG